MACPTTVPFSNWSRGQEEGAQLLEKCLNTQEEGTWDLQGSRKVPHPQITWNIRVPKLAFNNQGVFYLSIHVLIYQILLILLSIWHCGSPWVTRLFKNFCYLHKSLKFYDPPLFLCKIDIIVCFPELVGGSTEIRMLSTLPDIQWL